MMCGTSLYFLVLSPTALRPVEIVHAYERIADTTWAAVSRPVGGTLLTVARDAAAAARTALEESEPAAPASVSTICAAALGGGKTIRAIPHPA